MPSSAAALRVLRRRLEKKELNIITPSPPPPHHPPSLQNFEIHSLSSSPRSTTSSRISQPGIPGAATPFRESCWEPSPRAGGTGSEWGTVSARCRLPRCWASCLCP